MEYRRTAMKRMWINQPSTLQRWHRYHGLNVLVYTESDYHSNAVDIWFLSGSIISMRIDKSVLCDGWR